MNKIELRSSRGKVYLEMNNNYQCHLGPCALTDLGSDHQKQASPSLIFRGRLLQILIFGR